MRAFICISVSLFCLLWQQFVQCGSVLTSRKHYEHSSLRMDDNMNSKNSMLSIRGGTSGGKSSTGKVSARGRSMQGTSTKANGHSKKRTGILTGKSKAGQKHHRESAHSDVDSEEEGTGGYQQIENNNVEPDDNFNDDEDDSDSDDTRRHRDGIRPPKVPRKKSSNSLIEKGVDFSSGAASFAVKMTKGSIKSAVDLVAAKHVTLRQICGKWRISQEIEIKKGIFVNCPATIEIKEDGTVTTIFDGQEYKSEFIFKERSWPRKCTIQFNARAFQGPGDAEPRNMFYKGFFKRSLLNPNVVFIRGKVYRLSGKMFWKAQNKCGKFKATCTKKKYIR